MHLDIFALICIGFEQDDTVGTVVLEDAHLSFSIDLSQFNGGAWRRGQTWHPQTHQCQVAPIRDTIQAVIAVVDVCPVVIIIVDEQNQAGSELLNVVILFADFAVVV